jgi:hypothetical protein
LSRTITAAAMGFRDQARRPLLLILLVVVPAYTVTRSLAITLPTPRDIGLPGGVEIETTMRDLHGAVMAGDAIAFVTALCGVFVMGAALSGDRRLVIAGYRPHEVVTARLAVLGAAAAVVVAVSAIVTAFSFTPASWLPFAVGLTSIAFVYGGIGALAGAMLDKVAATYLVLFMVMTDLGIVQNPMFGDGTPDAWAALLPGYGPSRVMVDGAFSATFHAGSELVLSAMWVIGVTAAVVLLLSRGVRPR